MFDERQRQIQEQKALSIFFDSLVKSFSNNQSPTTTLVDKHLGDYKLPSQNIPIFRTDHFIGTTFKYSRYTAIFGGIRVSRDSYQDLIKVLRVLK